MYSVVVTGMENSIIVNAKKTKILATLGPTSSTKETINRLIENGLNAARLNFSHGTHSNHEANIAIIRTLEREHNTAIAIVQDLQGPKIRLGNISEDKIILKKNEQVTLFFGDEQVDNKLPVQHNIFPFLAIDQRIYINDGIIKLRVTSTTTTTATCMVIDGGEIKSHKGINLPNTKLPNISLTEKDKKDLAFGIEQKVDYVAISFIQDETDIQHVRELIAKHQHQPKIIAKIETRLAVDNLEKIIEAADAVMVARGDLAVETEQEEVPLIQRRIIKLCRKNNKPVIVATQMLESMIHSAEPTRAEVSDIANAVLDEVDAVMLSAETAFGEYPVEAVNMMNRIIKRVNKYYREIHKDYILPAIDNSEDQTTAIAAAATLLAHQLDAQMIFALTASGKTALRIASYRPDASIIAVTDNQLIYRQLSLVWGIIPHLIPAITNNDKAYALIIKELVNSGQIKKDDKIVLVTGKHPGIAGHTNIINVTRVGEINH